MTVGEVNERVAAVRNAAATDDASAHIQEDRLYHDVLLAIAQSLCADPAACAAAALETKGIEFHRWYS